MPASLSLKAPQSKTKRWEVTVRLAAAMLISVGDVSGVIGEWPEVCRAAESGGEGFSQQGR